MKPYRKSDQYYYDSFDRYTLEKVNDFRRKVLPHLSDVEYEALNIRFRDFIVVRHRERESVVKQMMKSDEEQDKLVASYKIPVGVKCEKCDKNLKFSTHMFDSFHEKLLFVFECVNPKHKRRTLVCPNGEIKDIPLPSCRMCGEPLKSNSKKKGLKLILTDQCTNCNHKEVHELELTPEIPVNESDRKKYCLTNYGSTTFMEDLKSIDNFMKQHKEILKLQEEKQKYNVHKIERKTIPQIKEILTVTVKENGFTDFEFEKPQAARFMIVPFNVMDSTTRNEDESILLLKKTISKTLAVTNWRLSGEISYRLGLLSGKLKGVEGQDDLLELAKKQFKTE